VRLLLIRHAHHDYIGKAIAGWLPGVSLSEFGRSQAAAFPKRLARSGISAIYSSPLERARETAAPLAAGLGMEVEIREGLREMNFGEFTGQTMAELDINPLWHQFNLSRSNTRAPGGELMLETQARMVAELERIRYENPDGVVAVFSHGEAIRTAVMHYAGIPLDLRQRIEVHPASVSTVDLFAHGPRIVRLNEV